MMKSKVKKKEWKNHSLSEGKHSEDDKIRTPHNKQKSKVEKIDKGSGLRRDEVV